MEQIALKSRLSIDLRIYVADQMGPLGQISHHLHTEEINLFCSVNKLAYGQPTWILLLTATIFGDELLVMDDLLLTEAAFAIDSQVFDQSLDAETFALEPLDEDTKERTFVFLGEVARIQG